MSKTAALRWILYHQSRLVLFQTPNQNVLLKLTNLPYGETPLAIKDMSSEAFTQYILKHCMA
jgi:hypothetical protein